MKELEKVGAEAIRKVAEHHGKSEKVVRRELQEVIDATWTSSDPEAKLMQSRLFPNGKPTPEEFIVAVSQYVKHKKLLTFHNKT